MISKRPNFKKLLLDEVSKFVVNYGFANKHFGQSFFLPKTFGRGIFHLSFIPHRGVDCDVTADVAIRVDAVEDILNASHENLSPKDKSRTATIGSELGNLVSGKQRRWTIVSELDVPKVSLAIEEEFKMSAIPFFERFSDIESIFVALSSNEPRDWIISPIYSVRCKSTVALAYVLGNRQKFDILTQNYEKSLRLRDDPDLDDFLELSHSLKSKFQT